MTIRLDTEISTELGLVTRKTVLKPGTNISSLDRFVTLVDQKGLPQIAGVVDIRVVDIRVVDEETIRIIPKDGENPYDLRGEEINFRFKDDIELRKRFLFLWQKRYKLSYSRD